MSALPPVLLVDDDDDDRELLSLVLAGAFGEVEIEEASDAARLARAISAGRFGLVLTEHELSWIRSVDVLRLVRDLRPHCPVVVVTGQPIERVASEILHLAPDGLVPKSSTGLAGLPRVVRSALFHVRRRAAAEESDAPARRLLDQLPAGLVVADDEGVVIDANPSLAALTGRESAEECVHRPLAALFTAREEGASLLARLVPGGAAERLDTRLRRADGSTLHARITAWRAPTGSPAPFAALIEDRSAERAASEALAARDAELARSNAELDQMAYVVSHDLRQPLAQIARYLELLETEAAGRIGESGRELVEQARASAGRLEGMVDGVLRLSRVESRRAAFAPVDLDDVAARVVADFAGEIEASGAEITLDPLPVVTGDAAQLEQLVQNLVENALKFHGDAPPRLHVGATVQDDGVRLDFRDQGIGLDPAEGERIFGLFQRLHDDAEIPGSGIGLAVCRRIAERHGGRIWVDSSPGHGATFHVLLPSRPSAPAAASERPR